VPGTISAYGEKKNLKVAGQGKRKGGTTSRIIWNYTFLGDPKRKGTRFKKGKREAGWENKMDAFDSFQEEKESLRIKHIQRRTGCDLRNHH